MSDVAAHSTAPGRRDKDCRPVIVGDNNAAVYTVRLTSASFRNVNLPQNASPSSEVSLSEFMGKGYPHAFRQNSDLRNYPVVLVM